ncbi:hypothetical protein BT93_F0006 [Corymbia citriodora subsp. variegata]|nr:hypothetical protein BT93_F0006 [Corymbia citriodora subsp. variegata]
MEHLFMLCPRTSRIWEKPVLKVQISSYSVSRMEVWLQNFLEQGNYLPSFDMIAVTLWCIWKARNNFVFRKQIPDLEALIDSALNTLSTCSKWNPQKRNLEAGSPTGAIACIIRDESGVLQEGFAGSALASFAVQLEALALLEGLKFVQERGSEVLEVQSDCLEVVKAVNSTDHVVWEAHALIVEAHECVTPHNIVK